jgi:hypothetical protein
LPSTRNNCDDEVKSLLSLDLDQSYTSLFHPNKALIKTATVKIFKEKDIGTLKGPGQFVSILPYALNYEASSDEEF